MNLCESFKHIGTHLPGGLSEKLWVPATALHRVPAGLDPYIAALAEPLACILNGTSRVTWHAGQSVAILGAGPIGLLFLAVAKLIGRAPDRGVRPESDPTRTRSRDRRRCGDRSDRRRTPPRSGWLTSAGRVRGPSSTRSARCCRRRSTSFLEAARS